MNECRLLIAVGVNTEAYTIQCAARQTLILRGGRTSVDTSDRGLFRAPASMYELYKLLRPGLEN